jgi:hypothetical protein
VNPLLAVALELAGLEVGSGCTTSPTCSRAPGSFGSVRPLGSSGGRIDFVVAWSPEVLRFLVAGQHAAWHDFEHEHCRTWIEGVGCRCDVEPL